VLAASHTKPLSIKEDTGHVVVTVELSGTFDGSPVTLDYHITIADEKITNQLANPKTLSGHPSFSSAVLRMSNNQYLSEDRFGVNAMGSR
jgi:hypothetical protein